MRLDEWPDRLGARDSLRIFLSGLFSRNTTTVNVFLPYGINPQATRQNGYSGRSIPY